MTFGLIQAPKAHALAAQPTNSKPSSQKQANIVVAKSGDTLYKIAKAHGTNAMKLFNESPGIARPNVLDPGDKVVLPGSASGAVARQAASNVSASPYPKTVTVEKGDSLWSIAQANETSASRLFDANASVQKPSMIFPGQTLRIPSPHKHVPNRTIADVTPAPANHQSHHTSETQTASTSASHQTQAVAEQASQTTAAQATHVRTSDTSESSPSASASKDTSPSGGASSSVWERVAQCESSGNWHINTGNGFYGGLQFTLSSWQAVGGSGLPSNASKSEQIMRANKLLALQGWQAWPACSAQLSLR
jgi:LysM repeat protein